MIWKKSKIMGFLICYKLKNLLENNQLQVRFISEFGDYDRVMELKHNSDVDDLEINEIREGDYDLIWLEKEEVREAIENILDDMDNNYDGKHDHEKELKQNLIQEASNDVETLATRVYYELFRAVDEVAYLFNNRQNHETVIMDAVSEMLFIGRDKTEMLFNAYRNVASRLYEKEIRKAFEE